MIRQIERKEIRTLLLVCASLSVCRVSYAELNDTGQLLCANSLTVQLNCNDANEGTDTLTAQDAEQGRDVSDPNPADGLGGFSFTKLDSDGIPLANQQEDFATAPWACVRDNVTGLTWEVKTDDEGLRDKDWTYTWFNSTGVNDGGDDGVENGGACVDADNCDTEKYTAAVNEASLCGQTDWRLPDPMELMSIMTFDPIPFANATFPLPPAVDLDFFPNTQRADYWTSYSVAFNPGSALVVFFGGNNGTESKSFEHVVRLVRGQLGAVE